VADIHFQPKVAMLVADAFEKIRINPGNFSDGRKTFEEMTYDDPKAFVAEREFMREVHSITIPTMLTTWCTTGNLWLRVVLLRCGDKDAPP
jgi:4-hydroxy-3-methylbut-2-en-1-yl diphosphate synthase IspG/GcpE